MPLKSNSFEPRAASRQSELASSSVPIVHSRRSTGDVVLVLNLPDLYIVGFDSLSFTAQHFHGFKHVPAGIHFFWVSHPSGVAPRTGVWLLGSDSGNSTHILHWDEESETLTETLMTCSVSRSHSKTMASVGNQLISCAPPGAARRSAARPQSQPFRLGKDMSAWTQLASKVNKSVLNRIAGAQTRGWMVHTLDTAADAPGAPSSTGNRQHRQQKLNYLFEKGARIFSLQSFGSDRTAEARDPTTYLLSRLNTQTSRFMHDDLIGELQFCFLVGTLLGNDACLEQWWYMINTLILKSFQLIEKQSVLVAALWRALKAQIEFGTQSLDTDLFDQSRDKCREMRGSLIVYRRRLDEVLRADRADVKPDYANIHRTFSGFESALTRAGWNLSADYLREGWLMLEDGEQMEAYLSELEEEDERGEWAPEVVQMDEHGRQLDLVSWND